jgi:type 1 glutamine amidotransferase
MKSEIRSPKSEGNPKSEIRNSKAGALRLRVAVPAAAMLLAATGLSPAADSYSELRLLNFGQSTPALAAIQSDIATANPAQLRAIEAKLIAALLSADATADAKSWVCRTLRIAGSEQAVPALGALLTDNQLAADAQFALRCIPGPAADQALRAALSRTHGLLQAGIVQTLGARADRQALALIAPLASDPDPAAAEAALYALGRIGGLEALQAVQNATVPDGLQRYRRHAILLCAESLLASGNAGEAARACRALCNDSPDPVSKSAALRCLMLAEGVAVAPIEFKVLLFSKTLGFRHANIPLGIEAVRRLGLEHGFAVDATEDSGAFTPENLGRYKTVIFLSVTGDVLDEGQQTAFKDYVLGGGGFVGIHGALFGPSACLDKWAWYGDLCGASFRNHSAVVPARVDVEDRTNPSTAELPEHWLRADEWYNYQGTPRGNARVLATVDESTYKGGTVGQDHPIAWCKPMGKGIMWYTAMGHTDQSFHEPLFLKHILGGIQLTARVKSGELTPNPKPARRQSE